MKLVSSINRNRRPGNQAPRSVPQYKNGPADRNPATAGATVGSKAAPVYQTAQKSNAVKPVVKKKSPIKAILISLTVVVVLICGLFIALAFYVDSLDTVFPNVWADGINVSGMTFDETVQHLINEGYESNVDDVAATVVFPDQSSFSVTGNEVGLSLDATEAASTVFSFGRSETFINSTITYIESLFERTELDGLSTPSLDDTIVRTLAAEYAHNFNITLFDSNLEITDESITIVKGTGLKAADENEVFNFAIYTLLKAVEENDHLTAYYTPEAIVEDGVDLVLLFETIHIEPVSSELDLDTLLATESSEGRTFDLDEAKVKLSNATNGMTIVIPIFSLYPELTQEEMQERLFRDVLSESTSTLNNNTANRINNVKRAAEEINGTVLKPGDTFSFNEVVGQRTIERGFRLANVIRNGVFVEAPGGGICQVSSTLHDAVLHTHLRIVERTAHGLRIAYMPLAEEGMMSDHSPTGDEWVKEVGGRRFANDATVSWGTMDYKFQNNLEYPVRIEAFVSGLFLTVRLHGTNLDGSFIRTETIILSKTERVIEEREDSELPVGTRVVMPGSSGQSGYRAEVWKRHYSADGELLSRDRVGTSTYRAQNRVYLNGTAVPYVPDYTDGGDTGDGNTGDDNTD
ncbi:MAG: VanW family protein [Oscillospiraceae bacterium]|nr:VanW family protein [Oscillospiraceae bacterium]